MKISGNKVVLNFDYTDGGLKTFDGGDVKGFFISGEDERFYPAQAVIKGNKLELTSDKVMHPIAVRYGWGTFFRVNLCNGAGIPAVPFRTIALLPKRLRGNLPIQRYAVFLRHGSWIMVNVFSSGMPRV